MLFSCANSCSHVHDVIRDYGMGHGNLSDVRMSWHVLNNRILLILNKYLYLSQYATGAGRLECVGEMRCSKRH